MLCRYSISAHLKFDIIANTHVTLSSYYKTWYPYTRHSRDLLPFHKRASSTKYYLNITEQGAYTTVCISYVECYATHFINPQYFYYTRSAARTNSHWYSIFLVSWWVGEGVWAVFALQRIMYQSNESTQCSHSHS